MVRRITLGRVVRFLGCLAATAACSEPGDEFGTSSAIVYGTVTRAGLPVSQVRVYPYARVRVCSEPTVLAPVQTTAADGRYRFLFQSPLSPQVGCLLVRALFETSSGTDSVTVRDIPITFTDDRTNPVPDSVRVDLVLPWSPPR